MIVAGVDIGNTSTEIVLAAVDGKSVRAIAARRAWTAGLKGSAESLRNAARLLAVTETAAGVRAQTVVLPPLHPVVTASAILPPAEPPQRPLRRLPLGPDGRSAGTPAGLGFGAGAHVPLAALQSSSSALGPVIVSIPRDVDFEDAAAAIASAQATGVVVAGVLAAGDDAVLIANRLQPTPPIVDEVDLTGVAPGERVALEVSEEGGRVRHLADPVALVAAFGLEPSDAARVAHLAEESADARAVVVVRSHEQRDTAPHRGYGWLVTRGDEPGTERRLALSQSLAHDVRTIRPGSITRLVVPSDPVLPSAINDAATSIRDIFAADLPGIRRHTFTRHATIALDAVPLAVLLAASEPGAEASAFLQELTERPTHTAVSEADAAALGALTTPGASPQSAVCDLGGGTIDLVWRDQRLTAAGAGELLSLSVATALGLRGTLAEQVKRHASFRAEAPGLVRYEDGSRGFTRQSLGPQVLGRLCYPGSKGPVPFSDTLGPEEWRPLRLALKQSVIGANVDRCLRWLDGTPAGLLLCGGAALDTEAVRIVTDSLRDRLVTVGRADVAGSYGPRYAVALGLAMWYARSKARFLT